MTRPGRKLEASAPADDGRKRQPGATVHLIFRSPDPPGIVVSHTQGDGPPPSGNQIVDPSAPYQHGPENSVHCQTVQGELTSDTIWYSRTSFEQECGVETAAASRTTGPIHHQEAMNAR
ncbi:MAG: hypothetical protein AB1758_04420 [Candidatus Eremiobacterota bacterium]